MLLNKLPKKGLITLEQTYSGKSDKAMFAYNHTILFPDEPTLISSCSVTGNLTITVSKTNVDSPADTFNCKSVWSSMSGCKTRFYAETAFADCRSDCRWALEIKDVVTLTWRIGDNEIKYQPQQNFTPERLQFWILHTLLPLIFTLENRFQFLHVGAVELNGKTVCLSAPSFGGKSTLTDYFIQQGHPLFSDDSLAIQWQSNQFLAVPGYPFHRPYRQPEHLGQPATNMARSIQSIDAIYLLEKVPAEAEITIEECKGVEKFVALHFSSFIDLGFQKPQRFAFINALAQRVPSYKITVPWQLRRLVEVYQAIISQH